MRTSPRKDQVKSFMEQAHQWTSLEEIAKSLGINKGQVAWCLAEFVRTGVVEAKGNRAARRYRSPQPKVDSPSQKPTSNTKGGPPPVSKIEVLKAVRQCALEGFKFVTTSSIRKKSGRPDRTVGRVLSQLASCGVLESPGTNSGLPLSAYAIPVPELVVEELSEMIAEMEARLGDTPPAPGQKEAVKVEEKQSLSQLVSDYVDQSQRMINVHKLKRHIKEQTGVELKIQEVRTLLDQCPNAVKIGSLHYNKKKEGLTDSQLLQGLVPHLLALRGKVSGFNRNQLVALLAVKGGIRGDQVSVVDRLIDWSVRSDILYQWGTDQNSAPIYQFKIGPKETPVVPEAPPARVLSFTPTQPQLEKMEEIVAHLNSMSLWTDKTYTLEDVFHRVVTIGLTRLDK